MQRIATMPEKEALAPAGGNVPEFVVKEVSEVLGGPGLQTADQAVGLGRQQSFPLL